MQHPFYGQNSRFLGQEDSWWVGLASMLLYLFFWAAVMIYAFRLVNQYFPDGPKTIKQDRAGEILRERYASGEIGDEVFEHQKAVLQRKKNTL